MKENNRGKDNHKLTLSIDRVLVKSKQERMRSMHIKRGFVTLERERKLKLNPIGLWRRLWQALIGCMKD